jgi:flagellar P-ring protein precursor FlgI
MNAAKTTRLMLAAAMLAAVPAVAAAERLKDIADIAGVRGNPLTGVGVVVGLNATGDNSVLAQRALANAMRKNADIVVAPAELSSKNIAAVTVTCELSAWGRKGGSIDVIVSALGNASSLQGGVLLVTELKGLDGKVHAVAQGPLSIGGFTAAGQSGSVSKNHATTGRIPGGAIIEIEELGEIVKDGKITLTLRNADHATSQKIADAINAVYADSARALDAAAVCIALPKTVSRDKVNEFIAKIGEIQVKVDTPALVVINERTGTIIVGENVVISTVAISHGNLSIITQEKQFVSQPTALSNTGTTEKVNRTEITAVEDKARLVVVEQVSVAELARALNAMGLTPRDMIAIFQALKEAGALQAQLKVM